MTVPYDFSAPRAIAGDTQFRYIISQIIAGMTSIGAVQVKDAGTLDAATAVYPTVANTYATGFLMFRFNGTLQGTKPIFIKFRVGRASGAATFALAMQVGTGTSGSGTLTGLVTTEYVPVTISAQTDFTTPRPCFVAGSMGADGTGWFTIGLFINDETFNAACHGYSVSRTRTNLGVMTDAGCAVGAVNNALMKSRLMDFTNNVLIPTAADVIGFAGAFPDSTLSGYTFQGETPVFPAQPAYPRLDYPDLGVALYAPSDVGNGQKFSHKISGAIHRYYSLGSGWSTTNPPTLINNTIGVGLRYE